MKLEEILALHAQFRPSTWVPPSRVLEAGPQPRRLETGIPESVPAWLRTRKPVTVIESGVYVETPVRRTIESDITNLRPAHEVHPPVSTAAEPVVPVVRRAWAAYAAVAVCAAVVGVGVDRAVIHAHGPSGAVQVAMTPAPGPMTSTSQPVVAVAATPASTSSVATRELSAADFGQVRPENMSGLDRLNPADLGRGNLGSASIGRTPVLPAVAGPSASDVFASPIRVKPTTKTAQVAAPTTTATEPVQTALGGASAVAPVVAASSPPVPSPVVAAAALAASSAPVPARRRIVPAVRKTRPIPTVEQTNVREAQPSAIDTAQTTSSVQAAATDKPIF